MLIHHIRSPIKFIIFSLNIFKSFYSFVFYYYLIFMKKLPLILFTLTLFISGNNIAQDKVISLAGLFGVQSQGKMKWASMDNFIDSYNLNLSNRLNSPVKYLRLNPGFVWGIEAQAAVVQFGYTHSRAYALSVADLKNGEKREFELDSKLHEIYMTMEFPTDVFDIGLMWGGVIHSGELRSGYIYSDGTRSYAEDKALNGIYDLGSHMDIIMGPRIDFGYKWIKFSIRAEYQGVFGKLFSSQDETIPGYRDMLMSNAGSAGVFDDGQTHHYLPEDWADQTNEYAYYVGSKPAVHYGYRGWRYTFVVRIAPLYKSDN